MRTIALLITVLDLIADFIDLCMLSASVVICLPFKAAADFLEYVLDASCDPGGDGFEPEDDGKPTASKRTRTQDSDEGDAP